MIKGNCNCKYKTKSIINEKLKSVAKGSDEEKELIDNLYNVKRHLTIEGLVPFDIARERSSMKKSSANTLDSETLEKKMKEGLSLKDRLKSNKKRLSFLKKD